MPRTIIGTLVGSDGNPLSGVIIQFRPMAIYAHTIDGEMVSMAPVNVSTDNSGSFTVSLYASAEFEPTNSSFLYNKMGYRIEIPSLGLTRNVQVPEGATPLPWGQLTSGLDND